MDTDVVLQSEASECALACIAMVASHHGSELPLRELRRRFPLSLKGADLRRLVFVAGELGFAHRPLRLELDELQQLATPCILHWDLNHYVVLVRCKGDQVTIHDPAVGRRTLTRSEVSRHFTGIALELTPSATFKQEVAAPAISLRTFTGSITGLWRSLALVLSLSVALQVFALTSPLFMQWVVDQVLVAADRSLLTVLGLGFGLALLLQLAIGVLRGWAVVYLSAQLGLQWASNVFNHLLKLPLDFFEKRHLGDITSRMGSVQAIQKTLTTGFVEAIIDGLMALVTLAMMLLYSAKLTLVTLLAVALYLALRWLSYRPVRDGNEQHLIKAARQESHLLESIRGIQSLKVAGCEPARRSAYANLLNDTVNRETWLARLDLGFGTASQLIFGIERIAVIWFGATLALENVFSVGMLVAYLAYKDQFSGRVSSLIDKGIELRMLRLHRERLADIVLAAPDPAIHEAMVDGDLPGADLEVRGVGFRYAEGEPSVLQDCSFTIADGESVAIVGASGCGKTTLAKVMLGLLPATTGAVLVGGQELRTLGPGRFRRCVAAVMQDDQLFATSLAENIALGDDAYDMERVESAARLAAIHDEIVAMPMGYHSLVGDMGAALSGGQKQRVILARALYRQPRILFLDEATSHLDVERERMVNEAVGQLQLTRVIIAHRPETIASADRVLVMHGGRIVQELRPQRALQASA